MHLCIFAFTLGKTFVRLFNSSVIDSLKDESKDAICNSYMWTLKKLIKKIIMKVENSEALARRCSVKKAFLKISRNSQENTCARFSFLIKKKMIKKRHWHSCFPVNFSKFIKTPFFIEHLRWLILKAVPCYWKGCPLFK